MKPIDINEIQKRLERDNPWWDRPGYTLPETSYPKRVYFQPFKTLALNYDVKRAVILLGPRRVGKTVMIKQLITEAINNGISRSSILYASIDAPIYSGISLEKFLELMPSGTPGEKRLVIFDEIQYLRDWELHMKDLVDSFPSTKFIATGSAAAALRLRSRESGAGRFSDFMLPPLTFYEFLCFINVDKDLISSNGIRYETHDIDQLNKHFIDYLNYGGYPEVVLNETLRQSPEQFIRNDIIDKVLLKDLPSLYGISEIQELNRLFSFLAFNAGNEGNLEKISQESGLAKPTIKKYIEYLESAFLIIKLGTVDDNCKTMKRERNFKIYLNNPSMRAALFAPVLADDSELIGHLAESAIFAQWQHSPSFRYLKYARWRNEGEVDIVYLNPGDQKPNWIVEIKWSDRAVTRTSSETRGMQHLLNKHPAIRSARFTTKSATGTWQIAGKTVSVQPSALYCYTVGRNITSRLDSLGIETQE